MFQNFRGLRLRSRKHVVLNSQIHDKTFKRLGLIKSKRDIENIWISIEWIIEISNVDKAEDAAFMSRLTQKEEE